MGHLSASQLREMLLFLTDRGRFDPEQSAALDLDALNLIHQIRTELRKRSWQSQRIGAGAIAYDTGLNKLIMSNGSAWEVVTSV